MDKIVCIGKNYQEHINELAHLSPVNPTNHTPPAIFLKPSSVLQIVKNLHTAKLKIPDGFGALHYETELVLKISKECFKCAPEDGHKYFDAISVGLDMTLRDLQTIQKKQGYPWTTSKVFPDSAVCGEWITVSNFTHFENQSFSFALNGKVHQTGKAMDMILSCGQCISYISHFFKLLPGDLVYTGTPAGVGPIQVGDKGTLKYHHVNYDVEWVA